MDEFDLELDQRMTSSESERDPILEARPTVHLKPLDLPPREAALGSTRRIWVCIVLIWVVVLGLVALGVQQGLVQDQWLRLAQEDEQEASVKWKWTQARLEQEAQRHALTGTQGVALWTWLEIRETALPPLFPNRTLEGVYELTQWDRKVVPDLVNATWWYQEAPSLTVTEWLALDTRQGTAQVYQSLDGQWLCATPRQHRTSTCVYLNAAECTSLSSVSYTDLQQLLQAHWLIHRSTQWCRPVDAP